ncbi:hypothetical protein BGZ99_008843 [Dissophora globulifera]|uniref:CRAL-TRIO domain-containing protein n=1 Tax=Dissophora globulifera TaxID=979702 RepID=A0A9P6RAI1_9FUNG|nr:hypothetical protein BGZ99_008843 [Dissophora globulifera]
MDWGFVRLLVRCFESYYPETLGVCVVHRAPFVFWGVWKLIQPLLDTVELHKVISRERRPPITHYDGLDDWKYEYVPATAGENAAMEDVAKKKELQKERHGLETKFDAATREWIKNVNGKNSSERDEIAQELREQYTRMTPYVRAKNLYQRWGVVHDGQVT